MLPGSPGAYDEPKRLVILAEESPDLHHGSADPRAYSRNKRGIAGSLIWINFDRHALLQVFRKARGRFLANKDDIRPQFRSDEQAVLDQTAIFNSQLTRTAGPSVGGIIDLVGSRRRGTPRLFILW